VTPCSYCGERPAEGEIEGRDDSCGYREVAEVCRFCRDLLMRRRER
jgi:hypothetical protein